MRWVLSLGFHSCRWHCMHVRLETLKGWAISHIAVSSHSSIFRIFSLVVQTFVCVCVYMLNISGNDRMLRLGAPVPVADTALPEAISAESKQPQQAPAAETLHRTYFPDTWLWTLQRLTESSQQSRSVCARHRSVRCTVNCILCRQNKFI